MTRCSRSLVAAVLLAVSAPVVPVLSQDKPAKPDDPKDKAIADALDRNKPSEHHKKLDALVGQWSTEWKVWYAPGKMAGEPTNGTATFKWTMDGRFLRGSLDGKMMGKTFESELMIGYNPVRSRYESTWVNSFEATLGIYSGEWGQNEKKDATLTLTGKADDCFTGRKDLSYRAVFTFEGKDRVVEEVFGPDTDGKEFKAVQIVYARQKKNK